MKGGRERTEVSVAGRKFVIWMPGLLIYEQQFHPVRIYGDNWPGNKLLRDHVYPLQ